MRFIDFIVFYGMANLKRTGGESLKANLYRAVFLASLIITMLIFPIVQLIYYSFSKIDIWDLSYSPFFIVIAGIISMLILQYIYIRKERYDYIISDEYNSFKLNSTIGVIISMLVFVLSIITIFGTEVLLHILSPNKERLVR